MGISAKLSGLFQRSLGILVFALLWELLPRSGLVSAAYLSPPSEVLGAIADLVSSGLLFKHLEASLYRSLAGLLLAIVSGVGLGLLMGGFRRLEALVDPLLQLFRQTSALALFPVFILFFGIGELSKVAIIFWASFWPILLSTISGVKQVDRLLIDSARSMGASRAFLFVKVVLPAAAPSIFTGVRLAGAYCVTALVAAEMIGAHSGLGFLTLNSQEVFQVPSMYAGILLLALVGLLLNAVLALIERRCTRWRRGLRADA
ncbi:Binding-protein-dependent transport systems inner membrane component [Azotobacter vinelandii CA]|uniref:Binding-protein-dependent transport systems inner membrane component n=2 Tax=Azotobacter vinelandii TaxID=354 RepID=C1DGS5_AZOVD|nr:ABC transporter permease [Azotobacter vinelandii]ACO80571.1 Binding-protein-dependent transport systems inner membrane component [Azotobacter vinelandii DJ]AGK15944.1 Binding-protein-dependent transport systems inner membrane component [Azotobacter vinelandii CA]AGK22021.1 Binding-protein-dependent transport systems inner membrane component [Azotobacter vinelandii CA6]WKN21331.1 ABC transporter permease [Azotobacter vinelandii]SFX37397.1 NitT/TauT family transport system permease protein [A